MSSASGTEVWDLWVFNRLLQSLSSLFFLVLFCSFKLFSQFFVHSGFQLMSLLLFTERPLPFESPQAVMGSSYGVTGGSLPFEPCQGDDERRCEGEQDQSRAWQPVLVCCWLPVCFS